MIVINKLEELEKYKVKSETLNMEGFKNLYRYEFEENGKLADVTFNIEIPFGISDLSELIKEDKNELLNCEFSDIDCYEFVANNVIANKNIRLGSLEAESFIFNDNCQVISRLKIQNKIKGRNLECEFLNIVCKEIECNEIIAESVMCEKLKTNSLITEQFSCENIQAKNVNWFIENIMM